MWKKQFLLLPNKMKKKAKNLWSEEEDRNTIVK